MRIFCCMDCNIFSARHYHPGIATSYKMLHAPQLQVFVYKTCRTFTFPFSNQTGKKNLLTYLPVLSRRQSCHLSKPLGTEFGFSDCAQAKLPAVSRGPSIQCSSILQIIEAIMHALRRGERGRLGHPLGWIGRPQYCGHIEG